VSAEPSRTKAYFIDKQGQAEERGSLKGVILAVQEAGKIVE
jgi:hypothetical protein